MLVLSNGEYVVVEFIQHEILEEPVKVYNFEVEDYHTYFVGEVSVLVHNGCGDTVGENNQSIVYRTLRDDEIPANGLVAKRPDRGMSIEGHVATGSRNNGSQFISTTTNLEVATKWATKDKKRVVAINLEKLPSDVIIYDLSTELGRSTYLKGSTAKRLAKASSEVLLEGYIPPEAIEIIASY